MIEIFDPRKKQEHLIFVWEQDSELSSLKDNYIVVTQEDTCLENYDFLSQLLTKFKPDYLSLHVDVEDTFFQRNNKRIKISNLLDKESLNKNYYNHFESNNDMIDKTVTCYKNFGDFEHWTICGYKEEHFKEVQDLKLKRRIPATDFLVNINLYSFIIYSNLDMSWWSIYFKDQEYFDDFLMFINSYKDELEV